MRIGLFFKRMFKQVTKKNCELLLKIGNILNTSVNIIV